MKSRFTFNRSNLPLILAGAVTVVSVIIVLVVMMGGSAPRKPADSGAVRSPPPVAAAAPDAVRQDADPIGDLIAGLPSGSPHAVPPQDGLPVFDGDPAWKRYATASSTPRGKAVIAVVIDDVGLNRARADDVMALPAAVTLAFMPYGENIQAQVDKARTLGHEVMLHLPMQPESDKEDPGPKALLTTLPTQELQDRVVWNMDRFTGYVGFNNHMGSKFTADQEGMGVVMREAAKRGLMFLDSRTTPRTAGPAAAARFGVPLLNRDIFIDNLATEAAVRAQLDKAAEMARKRGVAIIIGHPHTATVAALRAWIPTLQDVTLVPITAVLNQPAPTPAVAETR
ncbi:divergent polysaccharide deacetylase family protein [Emcibacter sp. SYSU 3D8]|uniref:divergent polysaccharide deacetylase family protein n=1 Tax=Emcibacter sp. SYSU 3D8 TaxID=3133969 RepID=UPI0031FE4DE5